MSVSRRLSKVFKSSKEIAFDDSDKFILFSDCHRGTNNWADDFAHNQNIFSCALNSYYDPGFTYIEIGDGDELWEARNFDDIKQAHSSIFRTMSKFHEDGRLHLIWGNHNRKWKKRSNVEKHLSHYYDELEDREKPLFKGITVHEGLILRHSPTNKKIFLTHGHQGDPWNDTFWWAGRFIVRYIWKFLQISGFRDPTSPAKNFKKRDVYEQAMITWADSHKQEPSLLIVGHTHRPHLPRKNEPAYCNTGSCVHPFSVTGIEIENGEMKLVRWFIDVRPNVQRTLFVNKKTLGGPRKLRDFP